MLTPPPPLGPFTRFLDWLVPLPPPPLGHDTDDEHHPASAAPRAADGPEPADDDPAPVPAQGPLFCFTRLIGDGLRDLADIIDPPK